MPTPRATSTTHACEPLEARRLLVGDVPFHSLNFNLHGELLRSRPGDYNRDGAIDVATLQSEDLGGGQQQRSLRVLFGLRDGGFKERVVGTDLWNDEEFVTLRTGGFGGDSSTDLMVETTERLYVYVSELRGRRFRQTAVLDAAASENYQSLQIIDIDGDGRVDILARAETPGAAAVLRLHFGDRGGLFAQRRDFGEALVDETIFGVPGDFNDDGRTDVAAVRHFFHGAGATPRPASIGVFAGRSGQRFSGVHTLPMQNGDALDVAVRDVDRDRRDDLVVDRSYDGGGPILTDRVYFTMKDDFRFRELPGPFEDAQRADDRRRWRSDFDHNGVLDELRDGVLLLRDRTGAVVHRQPLGQSLDTSARPSFIGDLNHDGWTDIVLFDPAIPDQYLIAYNASPGANPPV